MMSSKTWVKQVAQFFLIAAFSFSGFKQTASAQTNEVAGLYNAVLTHEGTNFYQFAKITLRTFNNGGELKVSGNVKVLFGEMNSNEFLTYEYPDVKLNLLTTQLSIRDDLNDVSLIGNLRAGVISGEWFSTQVGRVGTFVAQKVRLPEVPEEGILVRTLSGHYRGALRNANPQSNLPERITMSFVTTQENGSEGPSIRVTGNTRFYLGGFESLEFVETRFTNIQFNFYTRYLTAKTEDYGLTFKGTMSPDGKFEGIVLSDGLGEVGTVDLAVHTQGGTDEELTANP